MKEDARLSVGPRFKMPFFAGDFGATPAVNDSAVCSDLRQCKALLWLLWDTSSPLSTRISRSGAFSALDMNSQETSTYHVPRIMQICESIQSHPFQAIVEVTLQMGRLYAGK